MEIDVDVKFFNWQLGLLQKYLGLTHLKRVQVRATLALKESKSKFDEQKKNNDIMKMALDAV